MTAKEELNQYKYARRRVEETLEEYERYKTRAEKMTTIISGMPMAHGGSSDKVGDNAIKMVDLSKEYEERWLEAEYKKLELEKKIDKVSEPHRTLLRKKYIEDLNLVTIASEMGYSYNRTKHIHKEALQKYEDSTF